MPYNPERHRRRSIRLKGYDYSQGGAYFVTACVQGRDSLFGTIEDGEMRPNEYGVIVSHCWDDLPRHYATVQLDAFALMPNHIHGIILLTDPHPSDGAMGTTSARPPLGEIMRAFKTFSARRINAARATPGSRVWQRSYWEHVIRNRRSLERLRAYIADNPARWEADQLHPDTPVRW